MQGYRAVGRRDAELRPWKVPSVSCVCLMKCTKSILCNISPVTDSSVDITIYNYMQCVISVFNFVNIKIYNYIGCITLWVTSYINNLILNYAGYYLHWLLEFQALFSYVFLYIYIYPVHQKLLITSDFRPYCYKIKSGLRLTLKGLFHLFISPSIDFVQIQCGGISLICISLFLLV